MQRVYSHFAEVMRERCRDSRVVIVLQKKKGARQVMTGENIRTIKTIVQFSQATLHAVFQHSSGINDFFQQGKVTSVRSPPPFQFGKKK